MKRRSQILFKQAKILRFWLAIALIISFLFCLFSPLKFVFDRNFLLAYFQTYQEYAIFLFVISFTILTTLGIPGTVLTVVGGLIFGLVWGTFWSVIGATLGALGAFWAARYLLRDYFRQQFSKNKLLNNFDCAVKDNPFTFVLAVRFAPISPFNVVNFVFGLTPIHWLPYSLATFFGIIPGTLAYTWLGVSGERAIQGSDRVSFFIAIAFLTILSIIPICAKKRANLN